MTQEHQGDLLVARERAKVTALVVPLGTDVPGLSLELGRRLGTVRLCEGKHRRRIKAGEDH